MLAGTRDSLINEDLELDRDDLVAIRALGWTICHDKTDLPDRLPYYRGTNSRLQSTNPFRLDGQSAADIHGSGPGFRNSVCAIVLSDCYIHSEAG